MSGGSRLSSIIPSQSLSAPSHTSAPLVKQRYSQPSAVAPFSLWKPALHENVQPPVTQRGCELTAQLPPWQSASDVHVSPFTPETSELMHVLLGAAHLLPHVPQFAGSVCLKKISSTFVSQSSSRLLQVSNFGNTAPIHTGVPA